MFGLKKSWHSYKKELLKKYVSQLDKLRYGRVNNSLLITAVSTQNDSLFFEILHSNYVKEALSETDFEGKNALVYALFLSNHFYEELIDAGGVLSDFPNEQQEIIISKYKELLSYRKKCFPQVYHRYFHRLIKQIELLPSVNFETLNGETLLTVAVRQNDEQMIDYLLAHQASPLKGYVDAESIDMNALDLAVYQKQDKLIEKLTAVFPEEKRRELVALSLDKIHGVINNKNEKKSHRLFSHILALGAGALFVIGFMHDCQMKKESLPPQKLNIPPQKQPPVLQIKERQQEHTI